MNSAGKTSWSALAESLGAAEGVHGLHLRVPAFDAVVEVDGEDADVDGLDDVLVELLQALEFADFLFEAGIEAGVLEGDADVAGEGLEQLDVFAGEEVAADGAAEADDGDGAAGGGLRSGAGLDLAGGDAAGQIVVEVEQRGGALLVRADGEPPARFRGRCGSGGWPGQHRSKQVEEAEVEALLSEADFSGQAVRGGQAQAGILGQEDGDAGHEKRARQLFDDGLEQGLEIGFGAETAAELDQGLAIVVAMAVEGAIDPALNTALEGVEDGQCDNHGDGKSPLAHRLRHGVVHHQGYQRDGCQSSRRG